MYHTLKFKLDYETNCRKSKVVGNVRRLLKNREHLIIATETLKVEARAISCARFAEERVCTNKKWRGVIFTDKKRFNLGEPDGLRCYYHERSSNFPVVDPCGAVGKMEMKFITGKIK